MTENQLTASYHEHLLKRLRDLKYATGYLNAALEESDEATFELALQNVAEAQLRPLLKTPLQWSEVMDLLGALGIELSFKLKRVAQDRLKQKKEA